jgi:DNA-binding response OmpR family regulator
MRLLIIEDEIAIAELEKDYLEMNNYIVEVATNGKDGLKKALSEDFDLLILDLMIPEVDGATICREVRKEKDIPIIIVSAKKEEWDKVQLLGIGADDYMTKPFSPSELVARVKAHLARYNRLVSSMTHKPVGNDTIEVNGLKIDKLARRVFLDGEEKPFTGKEYDLLLYLAENPNRVFGKEDLFREIWKAEPAGTDIATVTVHIKKIREKIEKDSSHPLYIETLWGVGYRFKM